MLHNVSAQITADAQLVVHDAKSLYNYNIITDL